MAIPTHFIQRTSYNEYLLLTRLLQYNYPHQSSAYNGSVKLTLVYTHYRSKKYCTAYDTMNSPLLNRVNTSLPQEIRRLRSLYTLFSHSKPAILDTSSS